LPMPRPSKTTVVCMPFAGVTHQRISGQLQPPNLSGGQFGFGITGLPNLPVNTAREH